MCTESPVRACCSNFSPWQSTCNILPKTSTFMSCWTFWKHFSGSLWRGKLWNVRCKIYCSEEDTGISCYFLLTDSELPLLLIVVHSSRPAVTRGAGMWLKSRPGRWNLHITSQNFHLHELVIADRSKSCSYNKLMKVKASERKLQDRNSNAEGRAPSITQSINNTRSECWHRIQFQIQNVECGAQRAKRLPVAVYFSFHTYMASIHRSSSIRSSILTSPWYCIYIQ